MALIHCSECGREISDRAAACPGCGAPVAAPVVIQQGGAHAAGGVVHDARVNGLASAGSTVLGVVLATCQHLCTLAAVALTIVLLSRWNAAREVDPTFDGFNPWWPGLALLAVGAVFGLARRGLAAQSGKD